MKRKAAQEETTPLNALPLKKRKLWNHHQKRFAKTEGSNNIIRMSVYHTLHTSHSWKGSIESKSWTVQQSSK